MKERDLIYVHISEELLQGEIKREILVAQVKNIVDVILILHSNIVTICKYKILNNYEICIFIICEF